MNEWTKLEENFKHITDRLGRPIDDGIFETVVALNALNIITDGSCEGHLDHGLPYPWIDFTHHEFQNITEPERPPEMKELQNRLREINREYYKTDAYQQYIEQVREAKFSGEYRIFRYLTKFYENRVVPYDRIIIISQNGRIQSQGGDFIELLPENERLQKLEEYQDEMQAFTSFLKSLYFSQSN